MAYPKNTGGVAEAQLCSLVQRVERLREEIDALNADVSEVYKEAKAEGWNVHAMKALISERAKHAKNPDKFRELNDFLELYRNALAGGTPYATRVHAKGGDDPAAHPPHEGARAGEADGGSLPVRTVSPINSNPAVTAAREAGSTGEGDAGTVTALPAIHGAAHACDEPDLPAFLDRRGHA